MPHGCRLFLEIRFPITRQSTVHDISCGNRFCEIGGLSKASVWRDGKTWMAAQTFDRKQTVHLGGRYSRV